MHVSKEKHELFVYPPSRSHMLRPIPHPSYSDPPSFLFISACSLILTTCSSFFLSLFSPHCSAAFSFLPSLVSNSSHTIFEWKLFSPPFSFVASSFPNWIRRVCVACLDGLFFKVWTTEISLGTRRCNHWTIPSRYGFLRLLISRRYYFATLTNRKKCREVLEDILRFGHFDKSTTLNSKQTFI